ncbi:MAG: hypothetical protein RLY14_2057, partial [Planctomycetota bacterium]
MLIRLILLSSVTLALSSFCTNLAAEEWGQWRGPRGDGTSSAKVLPTSWSIDKNVAWKTPLPEAGNSTPVVWQDRIFLTQASTTTRMLMCFSLKTGELLWKSAVDWAIPDPTHGTNPFCSSSPVTDGER